MPRIAAIKFRYSPKYLWFDPKDNNYQAGDHVLVETERGREVGLVMDGNIDATDQQIAQLKTPLKPVIRLLTELDYDHIDALDKKAKDALPLFKELIEKHGLEMKPIEVEYLFSGDRAVFFFSSEERVDFRELVRDLSSQFHVRVDMRQIGARDEARMIGGLGHCGEELCCARFGGDFQPVSIRMAKEQDLPLNPTKISGACGRLMCCLRYEYEAYKDFKKRAPKKGTIISTPLGLSKIIGFDTPREMLQLRLEDGKTISVPMAEMVCEKDSKGCTKCSVSRETIDRCASSSMLLALSALDRELGQLEDKLDTGGERESGSRDARSRDAGSRDNSSRNSRQRQEQGSNQRTRRRRGSEQKSDANVEQTGDAVSGASPAESEDQQRSRPRPGQRSSGLRKRRQRNAGAETKNNDRGASNNASNNTNNAATNNNSNTQNNKQQTRKPNQSEKTNSNPGRRRRRPHKNNNDNPSK